MKLRMVLFSSAIVGSGASLLACSQESGPSQTTGSGGASASGGSASDGGSGGAAGSAAGGTGSSATGGTAGSAAGGSATGGSGNAATGGSAGTPGAARTWPTMGGDLSSTFNNASETRLNVTNASTLATAWTLETAGAPSGTPAVIGDDVYVTSPRATFRVNARNGDVKWRIETGASSSPAYSDGMLFVHDGKSKLHALDAASGNELWSQQTNTHPNAWGFSSPVVAGDIVIVGTSGSEETTTAAVPSFRGSVVAYEKKTGKQRWIFHTVDESHTGATVWSTPSVDIERGMVFVTTGNNYYGEPTDTSDAIIALDLGKGEVLWKHQVRDDDVWSSYIEVLPPDTIDHDFGANPVLFEATIGGKPTALVGAGTKGAVFYALDRVTGNPVWEKQIGPPSVLRGGMLNNGAFDGKHILVASNMGTSTSPGSEPLFTEVPTVTSRLAALDPATGDIVWDRQLGAAVWGPITVAGGVGFVSAEDRFEAFNVATGERLFRTKVAGTVVSGAVAIDGRVYFGSGMLYFAGIPASTFYALSVP